MSAFHLYTETNSTKKKKRERKEKRKLLFEKWLRLYFSFAPCFFLSFFFLLASASSKKENNRLFLFCSESSAKEREKEKTSCASLPALDSARSLFLSRLFSVGWGWVLNKAHTRSYVCSADTNYIGQLWRKKKNDKNSSLDDSIRFKYIDKCYKAREKIDSIEYFSSLEKK